MSQPTDRGPARRVYLNPKQLAFLNGTQRRRSFVGGRGSGKSTSIGMLYRIIFNELPRAKVFMAGLTYNQILTKTLPAAIEAWNTSGLAEYDKATRLGHYVVGCRPPAHFLKPFQPPKNFENAISFINGFTIEMLSMDRADLSRGGNYDGGTVDESALMREEVVNKILLPSIRSNRYKFDSPWHWTFCHFSSAAWLPSGQWIYKYEELQKEHPGRYLHVESTAYDNQEVLPPDYFADLRAELTDLEFRVEVMNERLNRLPNSFYPSFSEARHCVWKTYWYDHDTDTGLTVASRTDTDPDRPLDVSFDFNAGFTCCIVAQEHGTEYRIVNALHVRESSTNLIDSLVDRLLDTYRSHPCKRMNIYGDRNGNARSAGSNTTFYNLIQAKLAANGWGFTTNVISEYPAHQLKHRVINSILAEDNARMPRIRINQNTCKFLIMSILNTPITPDWKKDKSAERQMADQAAATHYSDAFDYLIFRRYAKLFGLNTTPQKVRFLT